MLNIRKQLAVNLLQPLTRRLEAIEIQNAETAHFLCRFIPSQCPFERDIQCFGLTLLHIPPLCKLNPFYDQLVELRFKALSYLADICGEDVAIYC